MSARSCSLVLPLAALLLPAGAAAQWHPAPAGAPIDDALYAVRADGQRCSYRVSADVYGAQNALRAGRVFHARQLLQAASRASAYACRPHVAAAIARALAAIDGGQPRYAHGAGHGHDQGHGGYAGGGGDLGRAYGRRPDSYEEVAPPRGWCRDGYGPGCGGAPVVRAMDAGAFTALAAQVRQQTFGNDKIAVLSTAARHNHFTSAQVGQLLGGLTFGADKLSALRVLAPRIVDRGNTHLILGVFTFSGDKQQAQTILGGA